MDQKLKFNDFGPKLFLREARSYIRDSKEMLVFLEDFKRQYPVLPENFAWMIIDYVAMYSNMPDDLSGPACREYLDKRLWMDPSTDLAMELLDAVQHKNYFEFADTLQVQETGSAIGQKQAPPVCCLGAAKLEEEKIYPSEQFQKYVLKDLSDDDETHRWFKRFIDDQIAACAITVEEAKTFVDWLNTLWPGIKFTYTREDKVAEFLDLKIIIEGNKIKTDLFIKETNKQLFLDYRSNHPPSVFKSIVYSQALRVNLLRTRICRQSTGQSQRKV